VLELRLRLETRHDEDPFTCKLENPLSNVVNPNTTRLRINENEENLRTGKIPKNEIPDKVVEIARDYAELQQTDKAISYLKQALRMKNQPDPYLLNLLGIYHGEKGDHAGQEKFYREAAKHGFKDSALFNLALAQHRRKLFAEAKKTITERNNFHSCGPGLTLKAQIEDSLNNAAARDSLIKEAMTEFSPPRSATDWELGWLITAARMAGDDEMLKKAQAEQKRRKAKQPETGSVTGVLPEITGALREVNI
jgi:tetratricopeptide (TPR) repeat protein